jgi:hypothetical protein
VDHAFIPSLILTFIIEFSRWAVSIVGNLSSAKGFASHSNLFVKYRLVASQQNFRLTHGEDNGQTWVAEREEVPFLLAWMSVIL